MADITAALVKKLRDATGAGMMAAAESVITLAARRYFIFMGRGPLCVLIFRCVRNDSRHNKV